MAELLDLPNELLTRIIKSTSPVNGLEELTSTCKLFYQLGRSLLQRHRPLKESYSSITFASEGVPRSIILLLCDFIDDDYAAQHVREVEVQTCAEYLPPQEALADINAVSDAHKSEIEDLVNRCEYIPTEEKSSWKEDIFSGCPETATALAITMLPNLESITLIHSDEIPKRMFQVIKNIAEAHQQRPRATHPLQELRHVILDRNDVVAPGHVKVFKSFAGLSSLETLSAALIEGSPSTWSLGPCSRLRSLEFTRASIDLPSLENIFRATRTLQEFTYLYEDNYTDSYHNDLQPVEWEPRKLVQSLLHFSKHSLVCLDLSSQVPFPDEPRPYDGYIGPLRDFECLSTIRLPFTMFMEKVGDEQASQHVVRPIKDMLPRTTKHVRIIGGCNYLTAIRLLDGLPEARNASLPDLDTIIFEKNTKPSQRFFAHTERVFESIGVSLQVVKEKTVALDIPI